MKENHRVCIQGELVNIEEELAAELCKSCLTTIQVILSVGMEAWSCWLVYTSFPKPEEVVGVNIVQFLPAFTDETSVSDLSNYL